jgi:D-serine deaminase-like pyridoxal phosphate-dependent protein
MKIDDIQTPALLVDLDAMESNLNRMADFFREKPAKLRPHFKNHKVPQLARKQLKVGAIGMTCATLREAEILVENGVTNILIANEIASHAKIEWLANLSRHADLIVAVDNEHAVSEIGCIARRRQQQLSVLVDINIGLNRCGVQPGEPALCLAKSALEKGLRFRGMMGYDGHLQVLPAGEERRERVRLAVKSLLDSKALIESAGIPVEIVSTAGTGTYSEAGTTPGVTEIQAGSYLLMDTLYANRGSVFTRSLTVLATVISRPESHRAVIDCGVKELSAERGLSLVKDIENVQLKALHAEHGLLEIQNADARLNVGQRVELWVHYSDATVNLHRQMYGVRRGEVEEILRIER